MRKNMLKRAIAALLAVSTAAAGTACGSNTRTALTVNGYEVPAGVYIYFANSAYSEAVSKLQEENEELDTTDEKAIRAGYIEGKDAETWIKDKATEMCVDFVATELKFDELGLSLTPSDESNVDMMMSYYWSPTTMEKNGISEDSFRKIVRSSYKSDAIFNYYYGIGGENGVTEEQVADYYAEHNIRAQYVRMDLKDGEGNLLKSDGKAEMLDMAEEYQERLESAYDDGGAEAVMTEMDYIQEDYNYYVTSVSEEAAGITGDEAATTTPRTTTTVQTVEEAAEEEADEAETAEEETEAESEEETTEEAETEEGETTEAEETDEESAETTAAEETSEETQTETVAPEAETTGEETETETAYTPYLNESIIGIVNEEDYDDPADISYNPDEDVYKKLLSIEEKDYAKPYIVQEDEQYYLVVRYDIRDRMTEDDLWSESAVTNANFAMYTKDYEALLDTWTDSMNVVRNEAAYKRYDPFKFDFS